MLLHERNLSSTADRIGSDWEKIRESFAEIALFEAPLQNED